MATQTLFSQKASQNKKLAKSGVKSVMFSTYRPVTKTLSEDGTPLDGTCPKACPFLTKCYANFSFTNIHQNKALSREDNLIDRITKLPAGSFIRHLVSGDFGMNDTLDDYLSEAIEAHKINPSILGYSYTHHWREHPNETFNQVDNFVVNASCETDKEVLEALSKGYPTIQVVPEDTPNIVKKEGFTLVICPAQTEKKLSCQECLLCARPKRKCVIGFRSHGGNKKKIGKIVMDKEANLDIITLEAV